MSIAPFVWEFDKPPEVVIEIVANHEGGEDTRKLDIYAKIGSSISPSPSLLAGILFAGTGAGSASAPGYGPSQAMELDPAALESVDHRPAGPAPV